MLQAFVFYEFKGNIDWLPIPIDRATKPYLPTFELYKSNLKLFFDPGNRVKTMALIIDAMNKGYKIKVRDFYDTVTFSETKISPHAIKVKRGNSDAIWMDRIVLDCDN